MGCQGADYRLVEDQELEAARCPGAGACSRAHRIDQTPQVWLVLSVRDGPFEAGQAWNALQLHVATARPGGHSRSDQPGPAPNLEDARRQGWRVEGDQGQTSESCTAGRQFKKLRPVELHAGETRGHEEVGQV